MYGNIKQKNTVNGNNWITTSLFLGLGVTFGSGLVMKARSVFKSKVLVLLESGEFTGKKENSDSELICTGI
jgi:hypothetical protein